MPPTLDQIVKDFQAAWNAGEQPSVAKFLGLVEEKHQDELLARLLPIDIDLRIRAGDSVIADDYANLGSDAIDVAKQNLLELDSQADNASMPDNESIDVTSPLAGNQTAPFDDCDSGKLPERIGRYRVQRVLGKGGFGLVYLAQDEQLSRPVAIKVPHAKLLARPEDIQLYVTEARTVANLDHPNIVPVHDVGSTPDTSFFIVSKFIQGSDLATQLKKSRLSYFQSAELVATVAEALHHAHKQGLVHRDVKPGNILIDHGGKPYVVDFGLALREQDIGKKAGYVGTLAYMSPEQARGEGHRVDGRSDIFSLGVVFYELLLGRRPFRGDSAADLLDQIVSHEPRPPRQLDDSLPKELERICLKMLSKRSSERYTTATDVAADLRYFLKQESGDAVSSLAAYLLSPAPITETNAKDKTPAATPTPDSQPIKIVPKGLRSFDAHDADFFLELLPGPQDRDGLPESIRFWKTRIEETDPDNTFSVGLIYGPSGCGKSSLVKAGLLPRLADSVIPIYVEATPAETESRLLKGLRRHCPGLPDNLTLKETLAALRRGQGITVGRKVLIVLDQFEQWLYSRERQQDTELVSALRQCDGEHVQCIVMVRDDFWLAVSRFMRELEVRLLEGDNSALADLFDVDHARRVLTAFGRAFGRLPERDLSEVQKQFLKESVSGLAEEGKVVCVRLALFAEMMKGKTWTPATLKEVGGTQGIGATFLEETFSASSAPPEHRYHQQAARAVLKTLLPESGSDIKGHMKSYDELLAISGYAARRNDFDDLTRILDSEIRLITPTDPEGLQADDGEAAKTAGQKYFQLTHDYLVPSLRAWLTRKQQETRKGWAELKLAERSALWNAKPENRHLPSLVEWIRIRALTEGKNWTQAQQKMMGKAGRVRSLQSFLVTAVVMAIISAGFLINRTAQQRQAAAEAKRLVEGLLQAETRNVNTAIDSLTDYRTWASDDLAAAFADSPDDSNAKLHAGLALLSADNGIDDGSVLEFLGDRLLSVSPIQFGPVRDMLADHKKDLIADYWAVTANGQKDPARRFAAACALASYDPDNENWQNGEFTQFVAGQLVQVLPSDLLPWRNALRPVKDQLVGSLTLIYRDGQQREQLRSFATDTLADYLSDDPDQMFDLLADADQNQFPVIFNRLAAHRERAIELGNAEVAKRPAADASEDIKESLALRQANTAVMLIRMEVTDQVWPLLKHSPDPRVRSYIIHWISRLGGDPHAITARFAVETDVTVKRSLLLSLGEFDVTQFPDSQRTPLIATLLSVYRSEPDAGLRASAEWLLRQWGQEDALAAADSELRTTEEQRKSAADNRQWYVNGQGQTFVILDAGEFTMGSPESEQDHRSDEIQHQRRIGRRFAISTKEVTKAQWREFDQTAGVWSADQDSVKTYVRTDDSPMVAMTWYEAVQYCDWLSSQEGIPEEQWCYQVNEQGKYGPGMKAKEKFWELTGYRLPTESEWEFACRAEATTSRYYGESERLLPHYAWYVRNSEDHVWPAAGLKPNEFGLFDMHGNVWEWCYDAHGAYRRVPLKALQPFLKNKLVSDSPNSAEVIDASLRVLRGGSCSDRPSYVRSAYRSNLRADIRNLNDGFRAARTYHLSP